MARTAEKIPFVEMRRAPRYDIHAPVRFRTGSDQWQPATTVNIGPKGLLMRTSSQVLPFSAAIDFQVALEVARVRASACVIACRGRVVWTSPAERDGEALVAVTIDDFELLPATEPGSGAY